MNRLSVRCLILACGNTLREDDGVGPWLADWAEERFRGESGVRVVSRHQWTPELAEEIAQAEAVIFVDCAINIPSGSVRTMPVRAEDESSGLGTHHLGAGQLLSLSKELYDSTPRSSLLLTIGAGSLELREGFSDAVKRALPEACRILDESVQHLVGQSETFSSDQRA
jgi:hydrogenase maturation protease